MERTNQKKKEPGERTMWVYAEWSLGLDNMPRTTYTFLDTVIKIDGQGVELREDQIDQIN